MSNGESSCERGMKPARHDALVTREGQQVLSWRTQRHMHTHAHTWRAHTHLSIKAAHHKMLVGKAHDLVALLEHNLPGCTPRWRGLEAVPMAVDVVQRRQQQQAFGVVLRVLRRRGDTVANSKRGEAGVRLELVNVRVRGKDCQLGPNGGDPTAGAGTWSAVSGLGRGETMDAWSALGVGRVCSKARKREHRGT